jgi:RNA polymerase sigma factor (sigma-70 family)
MNQREVDVLVRTVTDAELVAGSLERPARFGEIFHRHFAVVYGYLRRRVGADLAADLASETFVVAFRRRSAYDHRYPDARAWLFGIATNLLRQHRRTERRRMAAYARNLPERAGAADPGMDAAEDRVQAGSLGGLLGLALNGLQSRDRDVLLLFAWADLSYQEIGLALGIPTGTVRSRLARARRRLRESLGAAGPISEGGTTNG